MSEKTLAELKAEFKEKLFDYDRNIKAYDPEAQLPHTKYLDQLIEFGHWLLHFLIDLDDLARQKIRNFGERITTLEDKADVAQTVLQNHETRLTAGENMLQDHEQRITALEGGS